MEKYTEQISLYFQAVPTWPFILLGVIIVVGIVVEFINRRRRADAVSYYDSVFHEELTGMYPVATRWPDDVAAYMQPRLPILRDAFEVLRNFIPQDQLREYNVAWNEFYQFCRAGGSEQRNLSEASSPESLTEQTRQQQIFQQMVSELLTYTEQFKK